MQSDLIVQGPGATRTFAEGLVQSTGAASIEPIGPAAFRLTGGQISAAIATLCAGAAVDVAIVPAVQRLADFRLVALDMDSTLITIECIDELADLVGKKAEIAAITAAAMRGELDYQGSLRQRVAALAGIELAAVESVYTERLQLSPGAEALLERLRALGIKTLLVSGGFTFFTERLKQRLQLDFAQSNILEIVDGRLTGSLIGDLVDGTRKAQIVAATARQLGIAATQIIAMGDGVNDLPMMAEAGVSIAYRAKPKVREQATYSFNYVGLDGLLNLFR
ncbi:MAG: phosphoserine phosphatase SerB [Betaproteobacteria bacterium]|nr:phosphoserine phosphatase SerB [Betaproteobacteria bacterium]